MTEQLTLDDADIGELYREHRADLVRLANSYVRDRSTAEDVVHEVFAGFFAVKLRDPDAALGYLRRSTANRARDALRWRSRFADVAIPESGGPSAEHVMFERIELAAVRTVVRAALRTLSHQQRAVLVLRFYEGMTESQIAETLRIGQGSVKTYASRGKSTLAALLTAPRALNTREDADPHA